MHHPVITSVASSGYPLIDLDLTILIQAAIFLLLAILATQLLFKPYLKLREDREEGIEGSRAKAADMSAEADARLADYEQKLAAARTRANDEQRAIRTEAAAHQREVTDKARKESEQAWESARDTVRTQTEKARKELAGRADELAADIATKLLGREVA